ncbi:type IV pilus modification protein PilV [Pseudomonas batumici]|uniref:type IV pilus modification protein PilV n=1 Tax=Pseudomonas batumici TaxID=226910 RepID=UPI00069403C4|nr:type IV pilus modification protein PilV [Pseudomonas batumici]
MPRIFAHPHHKQRGFSLIECLIALLIMTIGLLGNAALQAQLSKESAKSDDRVKATNLAKILYGQMVSDASNLANYAYPGSGTASSAASWAVEVKKLPGAIDPTVSVAADGTCLITIQWSMPQDNSVNTYSVPFKVDKTL